MLNKITNWVLVKSFYERHSGLFFFLFFVMFGMVESSQIVYYHLSLMFGVISSPIFLGLVSVVWFIYIFKVIGFSIHQIAMDQNQVIMELGRLPKLKSSLVILQAVALMDLPVLLYSGCIIGVAIQNNLPVIAIIISVTHLFRLLLATAWIVYKIYHPHRSHGWTFSGPKIRWPWPPYLFFVSHVNNKLRTAGILTKLISILCLLGITQIDIDGYDIRLVLIGSLATFASHSVLVFEFRKLEDTYLEFVRSLPVSLIKRYMMICVNYLILLLPELMVMIVNKIPVLDSIIVWVFIASFLMLLHNCLYATINMDKHIRQTLFIFLLGFMAVISKLFWLAMLLSVLTSLFLFSRNYYQYEPEIE